MRIKTLNIQISYLFNIWKNYSLSASTIITTVLNTVAAIIDRTTESANTHENSTGVYTQTHQTDEQRAATAARLFGFLASPVFRPRVNISRHCLQNNDQIIF